MVQQVVVHPANIQDRDGARLVLEEPVRNGLPRPSAISQTLPAMIS
jgi:hypothetical protein